MGATGIRRKVDDLGRVVIPAGIRKALNIREGDAVDVAVEGERVILTKPVDACVFCGVEDVDLRAFRGRHVCPRCVGSLVAPAGQATQQPAPQAMQPPTPQPMRQPTPQPMPRPVRAARDDYDPASTTAW